MDAVWGGTAAMVKKRRWQNEEAFWQTFATLCGSGALEDKPEFESFYTNEFQQTRIVCRFNPEAAERVHAESAGTARGSWLLRRRSAL